MSNNNAEGFKAPPNEDNDRDPHGLEADWRERREKVQAFLDGKRRTLDTLWGERESLDQKIAAERQQYRSGDQFLSHDEKLHRDLQLAIQELRRRGPDGMLKKSLQEEIGADLNIDAVIALAGSSIAGAGAGRVKLVEKKRV